MRTIWLVRHGAVDFGDLKGRVCLGWKDLPLSAEGEWQARHMARFFKERRIKYQYIDLLRYGISRGELNSVKNAVGIESMIDKSDEDYPLVQYLASDEARLDKLFEDPYLIRTPIVRNGKQATVGYCPEVWKSWE